MVKVDGRWCWRKLGDAQLALAVRQRQDVSDPRDRGGSRWGGPINSSTLGCWGRMPFRSPRGEVDFWRIPAERRIRT